MDEREYNDEYTAFVRSLMPFEKLAETDPVRLVGLLTPGRLKPVHLTFAAESAAKVKDRQLVRPALLKLLTDHNALVREGAVYGLTDDDDPDVQLKLQEVAVNDVSPGVRAAALDTML